ncbi:MAG TPA: haloacid dehalogenase type II, partial [Gammaproteobacteria bacterium]|nr:haloacid dehalogenase type II [Gammaproteobacteria bacterium]
MKNGIKALVFDVGGSVFDWQTSTRNSLSKLIAAKQADIDDHEFVFKWRRRMFETLAEVRRGVLDWRNADQVHRDVLDELAKEYPSLELTDNECDELNEAWHRMDVWPDVPEALERLREDYIVSILTVLSLSIVVDSSKHAGINWDA